uniref:Uncharacterized protein n=1 Tax=Arundo donax TaxID=35708 RepID=A0A0A9BAT3_ARUDO
MYRSKLDFDSGVFVLKFLEILRFGDNISNAFSHDDVRNIRVQIVNELVFNKYNTADTSAVKNYYSPGHFSRSSHSQNVA